MSNNFVYQKTRIWIGGQTYEARRQVLRDSEQPHMDELRHDTSVGWYINVFAMRSQNIDKYLNQAKQVFSSREVYYETDLMEASKTEDSHNLQRLQEHGFKVVKIAVNRAGYYGVEWFENYIRWARVAWTHNVGGAERRVVAMLPPWLTESGDIMSDHESNAFKRELISVSDGSATDGPMTLWARQENMRTASLSQVKYTNSISLAASIMVAPNEFSGHQWFEQATHCVQTHFPPTPNTITEPHDLVFSFYGPPCFHHTPVWPESWPDTGKPVSCTRRYLYDDKLEPGQRKPAQTFMGAAWWALQYLTKGRDLWQAT